MCLGTAHTLHKPLGFCDFHSIIGHPPVLSQLSAEKKVFFNNLYQDANQRNCQIPNSASIAAKHHTLPKTQAATPNSAIRNVQRQR